MTTWTERIRDAMAIGSGDVEGRNFTSLDRQHAADWSACSIGERFAMDQEARRAIVTAWLNDSGLGCRRDANEAVLAILKSETPMEEALHRTGGNVIDALALLGVAFSIAVGDEDSPALAGRINNAVLSLAPRASAPSAAVR